MTIASKACFYPGSFDPVTKGHLDIVDRVINVFGSLNIVVMHNSRKQYLFTPEERAVMIRDATAQYGGLIDVQIHDGMLVDYCIKTGIYTTIRGIRALTDFDYEFQMALTNRRFNERVESVLFVTNANYTYVSSSLVKEIASYHADVSFLVPPNVQRCLEEKFRGVKS